MTYQRTLYREDTGEIVGRLMGNIGGCSGAGGNIAEIDKQLDGRLVYIDVTAKPPAPRARCRSPIKQDKSQIAADGVDAVIFSAVPTGAKVSIDGGKASPVTDGTLEFCASSGGSYSVVFTCFPYLDMPFSVVAT